MKKNWRKVVDALNGSNVVNGRVLFVHVDVEQITRAMAAGLPWIMVGNRVLAEAYERMKDEIWYISYLQSLPWF